MKFLFKQFALLSAIAGFAFASDLIPDGNGAVAFVNAVPLDTPTEIFLVGTSLKPEGFAAGTGTGYFLFSKPAQMYAKNGSVVTKEEPLTPLVGRSALMIVYYLETVLDSGEKKKELKILSVPGPAKKEGMTQRAILVGSSTPQTFLLNGVSTTLTPNLPSKPVDSGSIKVDTVKGEKLGEYTAGEGGNFITVIYPDLKGGFSCIWRPDSL